MLLLWNKYVQPDFDLKPTRIHYITTHNNKADAMNTSFSWFKRRINYLFPEIVGDFPDKIFPVEEKLQLKLAQVMFVKTIYHSKKIFQW
jgi:hypothetical protein